MNFPRYKNRYNLFFVAALTGILIFTLITFRNIRNAEKQSEKVQASLEKMYVLESILTDVQTVESGQRGFSLTGDELYLLTYNRALDSIKSNMELLLNDSVPNDTADFKNREELLALISNKVKESRNLVTIRQTYGLDSVSAYMKYIESEMLMNRIRIKVASMESELKREIQQSSQSSKASAKITAIEFLVLTIAFFTFLVTLFRLMMRELRVNMANAERLKFSDSLINSITNPIIIIDRKLRIKSWNKYAEKLYGWSENEVIGKDLIPLLQIDFLHTDFESIAAFYQKNEYWSGEMIHHNRNNRQIHVQATVSRVRNQQGKIIGAVSVITDITLSKSMEKQLQVLSANLEREVRRKVAELNHVFDRITDAFIALDHEWNYTYVNEKAAELHGLNVEELLGKNIWDLHPDLKGGDFHLALQEAQQSMKPVKKQLYFAQSNQWFEDLIYPSADGISIYYHDITDKKRAELKLQEAENRFRRLVEESMVGVYILQHGKCLYVNPRCAEITGYSLDEMVGKMNILDIISPKSVAVVKKNIELRLSGKVSSMHYELEAVHKDGRLIQLEAFGSYILYNGEPAIIGSLIDISTRKKAEEQVILLNERFQLVAKATQEAIWDWDMENDTITGNERFSDMFGIAHNSNISFSEFTKRLQVDDGKKVVENLQKALQEKKDFVTEVYMFTMPDGSKRYFNDRSYILYNDQGKAYRMLGAMQDITEQTVANNNLIDEKVLSDNIINSLPGIFYIFEPTGMLIRWNKNLETITGYSPAELSQMNVIDFFMEHDIHKIEEKIRSVLMHGEDKIEADLKLKDGRLIPFYLTGMSIWYEGNSCIMGVGLDMSDKREAQEQLQKSEEKFRTLIEQASDVIFITDASGTIQVVNTSATLLTGYPETTLLQMKLQDILWNNDQSPIILDENNVSGQVLISEKLLINQHKTHIPVECSSKQLTGNRYQYIIRDITRRKKAADELRASENKYRLLFEENPMPMWMLSVPSHRFIAVNESTVRFYGYSRDEFLQMGIEDIRLNNTRDRSTFMKAFQSGIQNAVIWEHRKKNGDKIMVSILSHDVMFEGQHALLELATDMTEKIMAEESLKQSHEQLRMLASYLEKARESERTHIAREIHDELGQQITGLKMDMAWLRRKMEHADPVVKQKLKEIIEGMNDTVATVRNLAMKLRPSLLDDLGLVAALEWQSEEFQKRTGIQTHFESDVTTIQFPEAISTNLFRIFQESLTNIARHARATRVEASLVQQDGLLVLEITDNGTGFDAEAVKFKNTLGLLGMKERTLEMNGTFDISGLPGMGTRIHIAVPVKT